MGVSQNHSVPLKNRSTFTRRIMEARDVIERRSLNILYLYRPGRERAESGRKEGKKKQKRKKKEIKTVTASTHTVTHRLVQHWWTEISHTLE